MSDGYSPPSAPKPEGGRWPQLPENQRVNYDSPTGASRGGVSSRAIVLSVAIVIAVIGIAAVAIVLALKPHEFGVELSGSVDGGYLDGRGQGTYTYSLGDFSDSSAGSQLIPVVDIKVKDGGPIQTATITTTNSDSGGPAECQIKIDNQVVAHETGTGSVTCTAMVGGKG